MGYSLRPAITSEAKPLIGLYSESGNGKTKSALLLAKGYAEDMSKVAMIETEAGRGEVYAKDPVVGGYLVRPIRDNFAPLEYGKAITDLEKGNVQVSIIDSASHEWEGSNGVLGWAAKNMEDGKKGVLVWQQPKMSHQRDFILRLLQTPIPLVIVCMRAKYPMKEELVRGEKKWTRSEILEPKQADDILFEMMVHGWIDAQHNFHGTKYTTDDFRTIFIDGKPITVETGKRLAAWAKGGISPPAPVSASVENAAPDEKKGYPNQKQIEAKISGAKINRERFKEWLFALDWITMKDDKPSMSTISEKNAKYLVDKWASAEKTYTAWLAKTYPDEAQAA